MTNKKISGVYKITNPKGRVYIGSSINIKNRLKSYRFSCNNKSQILLYRSLLKYGYENHLVEIVKECPIDELFMWERYYGDYFKCLFEYGGLNLRLPGANEKKSICSQELRDRFSEIAKNRKYSIETRLKFSKSKIGTKNRLGTKHSDEGRKKISINRKGKGCGSAHGLAKLVVHNDYGIFYETIKEAAFALSINPKVLSEQLRVNNKKGYCKLKVA